MAMQYAARRRPLGDEPPAMVQRVLVVEDEDLLRGIIVRNLASRGCAVREAASGAEALAALRAAPADLLLLDIDLPDRTGWDVLRELAAAGQQVPTVVLSAVRVSPARLAEFRPLAYLRKPFPIEALLRLLEGGGPAGDAEPGET